jgi:signal transduction histidine kinase
MGAALTHDLNNHLAVIMGNAALLRSRLPRDGHLVSSLADDMVEASSRAAEMTRRVMGFVRNERDDAGQPLDLGQVIAELTGLMRTVVGRSVKVDVVLGDERLLVRCTRARIEQIVVNLVSNARDAMPAGGTVTVRLRGAEQGRVDLEVTDTGSGIAADVRPHLFEPFFTTKDPGRGTGLGLVSIKILAERDAGTVSVESVVGEGTTFTVSWPRAGSDSVKVATSPART